MRKFQLRKLRNGVNASDDIASIIREMILDGSLAPGLHLVEEEIARELQVSRIPVREAISILIQEGLVIKEPYKGAYVHPYTEKELDEIASVRVVLEQLAVEYALKHWNAEVEMKLSTIIDQMEKAWQIEDRDMMFNLDTEYHDHLYQAAQHDVLFGVLTSLRSRISRFLHESTAIMARESGDQPAKDHRDLLRALSSGDVKFAQAEMVRHLVIGHDRIKRHYAKLRASSKAIVLAQSQADDGEA